MYDGQLFAPDPIAEAATDSLGLSPAGFDLRYDELITDSFAGGGGASTGIEMALGRSPDIAINHDADALAMHAVNHPRTTHFCENIWQVDPLEAVGNRPVGLAWFSPDCKHFSKAKGAAPVKKNIRDLAWVVVLWAKRVRPRVIMLENVEEFRTWGPLDIDGKPDPARRGQTFDAWTAELRRLGYKVEFKELRACDYGAPTSRKRLFMIARRDGKPIVWPKPTHGRPGSGLLPYRTAADIIDWSIPCPSIFLTREEGNALRPRAKRPLEEATMARIAKGVKRYVIDAARPFIVPLTHTGSERVHSIDDPMRTITTAPRGELALVSPLVTYAQQGGAVRSVEQPVHTLTASAKDQNCLVAATMVQTGYGERARQEPRALDLQKPLGTVVAGGGKHAVVAAHLSRQFGASVGSSIDEPVGTVTAGGGGKTAVVAAHITKFRTGAVGSDMADPLPTVTANSYIKRPGGAAPIGGVAAFLAQHNTGLVGHEALEPVSTIVGTGSTQAVVEASLLSHLYTSNTAGGQGDVLEPVPTITAGGSHIAEVRAFLMKYYGSDQDPRVDEPLHTVTTKGRFGLVLVEGILHRIVDIGMRMLSARELFRAQGFPESYRIEARADGTPFSKTAQIRMCGNSVCPPLAEALVRANFAEPVAVRAAA